MSFIQFSLIVWLSVFVMVVNVDSAFAEAKSCGTATITGGETCESLKVELNVADCGVSEPVKKVWVSCKSKSAVAGTTVAGFKFRQKLKKSDQTWGRSEWTTDGPLEQMPAETAKKEKPAVEKVASAPTPPANTNPVLIVREPAQAGSELPAFLKGVTYSALFDGHYIYNFNHPAIPATLTTVKTAPDANLPVRNNPTHYYDAYHNQMTLAMAELEIKKTGKEVSFLVDFDFGTMADLNVAIPQADNKQITEPSTKHIGQAVLTYTPEAVPGLTVEFGKLYTHIGLEVIKTKDNWQYSRSMLFGWGAPFWHTGLHIGYDVLPGKLTVSGYVYNGWNSVVDNNTGKSYGAQVKYVANESLVLVYNHLSGPEQDRNDGSIRAVDEFNFMYNITSRFSLSGDVLFGRDQSVAVPASVADSNRSAYWNSATLAMKFQAKPWWYVSPRGEVFTDEQAFIYGTRPQTIQSYTLTNGFTMGDGFETRIEFRHDSTSAKDADSLFQKGDGTYVRSQTTALIGLLYNM